METREGVREERAGLVSLGLIMQLVGSIVAAYLVARSLESLVPWLLGLGGTFHVGDFYDRFFSYEEQWYQSHRVAAPAWHLTLVACLGIVRAVLHRSAGGAILYRRRGGLGTLYAYLAAAALHTGVCLAFLHHDATSATFQWSVVALLGTAWPLCLLVAATRARFRSALRAGPAATDATAPDEVATLSIFLGLVGAMAALFVIYASMESWSSYFMTVSPKAVGAIGVLLLVRSLTQLGSGFRVAGRAAEADVPLATTRYVQVGLIASVLAGAVVVIHLTGSVHVSRWYSGRYFENTFAWQALATHAMVAYLIVLWPVLLCRFVRAHMAAPTSSTIDAGQPRAALAALGWLLLAAGGVQVALALVAAIPATRGTEIAWDWVRHYDFSTGTTARSAWVQLLVAIPQIWTAIELLGATRRRRAAATAYAGCASLAIALSIWGDVNYLIRLISGGLSDPSVLLAYLQFAFPLIVPIATLVFVQHHLRRGGSSHAITVTIET